MNAEMFMSSGPPASRVDSITDANGHITNEVVTAAPAPAMDRCMQWP